MAREAKAAADARLVDRPGLGQAVLVSATNQDGTPFSMPVTQGVADALVASGKATAPAAGAAIATLAAPPAGTYKVTVQTFAGGGANADVANMKLQKGGADLYNPIFCGPNSEDQEFRITLNGSQNLSVLAVGAGTAAVIYHAQIVATRVE